MRKVYINGQFVDEDQAKLSIFDRGFLFADAVYEGIAVVGGKLIDFDGHIKRLERSCGEIDLPYEVNAQTICDFLKELVAQNALDEGFIYLQVTRGAADRDFVFDNAQLKPSVIAFTQKKPLVDNPIAKKGISIISVEDIRWGRCDIKTVQLLYPSLSKMEAQKKGADDAWFISEGVVLEGTSNNAFIVTKDNCLITRPTSNHILPGITRASILSYAQESDVEIQEREFTIEEAYEAKEAFITSASTFLFPVIKIDGHKIGDGQPGTIAARIRQIYIEESLKRAV